jgi:hypothetical protein
LWCNAYKVIGLAGNPASLGSASAQFQVLPTSTFRIISRQPAKCTKATLRDKNHATWRQSASIVLLLVRPSHQTLTNISVLVIQLSIKANMFAKASTPPSRITRPPGPTCQRNIPIEPPRRTSILDKYIGIWAWPSKGGFIALDQASIADFTHLGLDPLDPQEWRLESQEAEDEFCQRLLHLGAKWWDSEARFGLVHAAAEMEPSVIESFEQELEPCPTMRERRWVSVGWPSKGGLWVGEFDTTVFEPVEHDNIVPIDTARLMLASTMDDKCRILREHFDAKFYQKVEQYQGYGFLNSWDTKEAGEVGPLE